MPSSDTEISKFMSYVLRHAPQELALDLDSEGWTDFTGFSDKLAALFNVTHQDIRRVITENPKKRFTLEGDRIRAAQGHSVAVDLQAQQTIATTALFHGTTATAWAIIKIDGLKPLERAHVHLSSDLETARQVAARRKGPHVLLTVDAPAMQAQGYTFIRADNGVWLTQNVPADFLSIVSEIA